ncbi:serine hydrolase [uncultured Paraglaciecola sp.]|uniref:serine hydrolase domain-containing protein n=1 Tax=uncultured Paraglaciecola sp. TaxID=1765024 RepID=UPI00262EFE07|nr:serine hydrolase domain-containing protein [uncultured Paraglaciecola sp.]
MFAALPFQVLGFLLFTASSLATPSAAIQSIDQNFSKAIAADTLPGLNVAIADKHGIVWAKGYGFADVENQVAMTPKHKMRIGSIAKLITAAGLMRLYEQQKLSLDTPVTKYVEVWPTHHAAINLKQLASHTSGVRSYKDKAEFLLNEHYSSTLSSLNLFKEDPLLFEPGTKHTYSTLAYTLIAAAMEGADKERNFKKIIQQEVFNPLGMQDSAFDDQADIIAYRQRPYTVLDGKLSNAPQSDHSYKYAGGGFIATPSDISRFAIAHSQAGYLKPASLKTMFTKAQLKNGQTIGFGIGWMIDFDNYKNRPNLKDNTHAHKLMASFDNAVMHSGGSNGGTTMLILCRDHQRSITVVKNVDNDPSADVFLLALESLSLLHTP